LPTTSGTIVTTGSAASLTTSGNLTFTGTGNRILGDFSNATFANRVAFQSSTTNGNTTVFAIPNGTSNSVGFFANNDSALTNGSEAAIQVNGTTDVRFASNIRGTGTYLPMLFVTGGSESLRISPTSKAVILAGGSTSANGTGITFPATQSASSDANTLDDYEEGTWTPVGNVVTLSSPVGIYTKVGNVVHVSAQWTYPANSDGNAAQISGLPFTSSGSNANFVGALTATNYGSDNLYVFVNAGSTVVLIRNNNNNDLTNANLTGKFITLMSTYRV
jgi:hypothetical protein